MRAEEVPEEVRKAIAEYERESSEAVVNSASSRSGRVRRVLDLGTGSGCIPVSILKLVGNVTAVGVDISPAALQVAYKNAEKLGVADRVDFVKSDFFSALSPELKFDYVVSNPPYLVRGDKDIWPEVTGYDPEVALYAQDDGLACYRVIIQRVGEFMLPGGSLLLELGAGQYEAVSGMVKQRYPQAEVSHLMIMPESRGYCLRIILWLSKL